MLLTPTNPSTDTLPALTAADEARAIDLLHAMVSTPSVSWHEQAAVELLAARMRDLGFRVRIDEVGNVIGERGAEGPEAREIILLGHIDTVPGDVKVRREGDLLYGRGAVDAKGPLSAFVMAAATAVIPPDTRLVVIGAVEEETPTSRGARHLSKRTPPYACIIGEPSGSDGVVLGYKGRLLMDVSVSTPSAHTAGPHANAAELAVAWWQDVQAMAAEFNAGRERAFDRLQVRIRSFQTSEDGLADRAVLSMSFRLPTDLSPDLLEARLRQLRATRSATALQLRFAGHEEAVLSERTNPVARALTVAIRESGNVPRPTVKTGTSDMNVVGPVWRCPITAYGPGDSALDHTPNEHISITEYLEAIGVLRRALKGLAEQVDETR